MMLSTSLQRVVLGVEAVEEVLEVGVLEEVLEAEVLEVVVEVGGLLNHLQLQIHLIVTRWIRLAWV